MNDDTIRPDDALLAALATTLANDDPVPGDVVDAAKASFTWLTIDEELAQLTYDSIVDLDVLVGVRGDGPRALTFEADGVVIELEVQDVDERRTLRGLVTAEALGPVELHLPGHDQPVSVVVDSLGRFRTDAVPAGPVRLRCSLGIPASRVLTTEWLII